MNETKSPGPRLPVQASVDRGQGLGSLADAPGVEPSLNWGAFGNALLQDVPGIGAAIPPLAQALFS